MREVDPAFVMFLLGSNQHQTSSVTPKTFSQIDFSHFSSERAANCWAADILDGDVIDDEEGAFSTAGKGSGTFSYMILYIFYNLSILLAWVSG